jgi:hypothetical protein
MRITYKDRIAPRSQYNEVRLGGVFLFDDKVCIRVYGNRAVDLATGKFVEIGWHDHIQMLDAEVLIA